jgi:HNH endonuclease
VPNRFSKNYRLYLFSYEWLVRRSYKLQSVGYRCENCGEPWSLQVHHLTYDRLGHERDSDLLVLCRACHMNEHKGAA